uniref:RanBP2-type domain-containing protein n=1 Tax=Davidia involucrata TaxID=16924 RepID=A0A5B7A2G3_DAVIN
MGGGEGREGDWECSGCGNRNYAFRSFCNRCKQPRLLVDIKTPADSKWLPRIGDWICTGCTNNNYASREKCKKCGQPKEVAAMPAIAMPGASLPSHPHYFARAQGELEQKMNIGLLGNGALQQSLPLSSNWSGVQPASTWPLGGNQSSGLPYANQTHPLLMVPQGWRIGDWICNCGFHNYSSRAQCKKCNASMTPGPALGTKRLASEEFVHEWDNKRLNAGHTHGLQQAYPGFEQMAGSGVNQTAGVYPPYPTGSSAAAPIFQVNVQLPHLVTTPTLLGKGAKQWRDGDWMCTNCNNHNYASRSQCNRCKTQRDGLAQPVSVA